MPEVLLDTDVVLSSERTGYEETTFRVPSVLRLMTVAMSLIRRELDALSPGMRVEVDEKLR